MYRPVESSCEKEFNRAAENCRASMFDLVFKRMRHVGHTLKSFDGRRDFSVRCQHGTGSHEKHEETRKESLVTYCLLCLFVSFVAISGERNAESIASEN